MSVFRLLALLSLSLGVVTPVTHAAEAPKPNIILILADDYGLDGVGCYGSNKHKTPNIDKLAASGTRFESCYASPLCGPTRCLLMTGRYAFRTGGLLNASWRGGGPGANSVDEQPMGHLALVDRMGVKMDQFGDAGKALAEVG